jgi:hypothetical protein
MPQKDHCLFENIHLIYYCFHFIFSCFIEYASSVLMLCHYSHSCKQHFLNLIGIHQVLSWYFFSFSLETRPFPAQPFACPNNRLCCSCNLRWWLHKI